MNMNHPRNSRSRTTLLGSILAAVGLSKLSQEISLSATEVDASALAVENIFGGRCGPSPSSFALTSTCAKLRRKGRLMRAGVAGSRR
jgi:hypothetical protein